MNLLIGTVLLAAAFGTAYDGTANERNERPDEIPRIRTSDPVIAAAVEQATGLSTTFRRLAEAVQSTDGIVYIEIGICGGGASGCLRFGSVSGPNRILRIIVVPAKSNVDIGTVAHELQHALEVLRNPSVRSAAGMSLYYMRFGISTGMDPRLRETPAAVAAGHAVRLELRNATRAAGRGRTHVTDITASK